MIGCDYSPLKAALERLSICDVWQSPRRGRQARRGKRVAPLFRQDKHPSFVIYADGRRWHDHATGEGGDAADFCAKARGLSREDGARLLIELAGTRKEFKGVFSSLCSSRKLEPYDPFKDPEKARKRRRLAGLRGAGKHGDRGDRNASRPVARGRRYRRGARSALLRRLLRDRRVWTITDSQRFNAQARRLDGQDWLYIGEQKSTDSCRKCWSLADRTARGFALSGNCLGGRWAGSIGGVSLGVVRRRRGTHCGGRDDGGFQSDSRGRLSFLRR